MSPRGATFELERFSLTPVTADVVLVEVAGRLARAPARSRPPRLLVESESGTRKEHEPVAARLEAGELLASFNVPAADAAGGEFALAVGGLLLDLPAPDPVPGADRTVSLARELNVLRQEMTTLRRETADIRTVADERQAEDERARRDAAEREADALRAAEARAEGAERLAGERAALAEQAAAERVAEAERVATERIAEAERVGEERRLEVVRVAAERQQELLQEAEELERSLVEADQRDGAAAGEHARLAQAADMARDAAAEADRRAAEQAREAQAARAEVEELRHGADSRAAEVDTVERPVDADATTVHRFAEPGAEPAAAPERPADDPAPDTSPEADDEDDFESRDARGEAPSTVAPPLPDDTGPVPLRRGTSRPASGSVAAPSPSGRSDVGAAAGPSQRTVAIAATALAIAVVLFALLVL